MSDVMTLINKLYGNQSHVLDNVSNVMGLQADNQKELSRIKANGYSPVKAAINDSHHFSYDDLGYPTDAINNAKQDIHDIKHSETAQASPDLQTEIKFDQKQIKQDERISADELVMISRLNNGKITRQANPQDIEMIYHNTHDSNQEILHRHPKVLAYTQHDADLDAKQDLK